LLSGTTTAPTEGAEEETAGGARGPWTEPEGVLNSTSSTEGTYTGEDGSLRDREEKGLTEVKEGGLEDIAA
jgi:hypothetical protein